VVLRISLLFVPFLLLGGNWTEFRYGPFEVLTEDSEKEARATLNYLEQLRHATGTILGAPDLQPAWPVRVVLLEDKRARLFPEVKLARDAYVASIKASNPATTISVTKLLLDSFPGHIPPNLERGLLSLLSTLGAVPAQMDRDWSGVHMLAVHPDYSGKLRVLLGNLGRGIDRDVAFQNAFQKSPEDVESDLNRYIEAGQYGTTPLSGKPISAQRQFRPKEVDESVGRIALADVLLAHSDPGATAAYQTILKSKADSIEAREGLGLMEAQARRPKEAAANLAQAKSARALLVAAEVTEDLAGKKSLLAAAAKANPKWAEPQRQLARVESHPAQKLAALRAAAQIEPRNPANWIALAEAQEANNQFADAGKSWSAAERATDDPNARDDIRRARTASEDRRVAQQIATRDAERRKTEQELQDLRNKALLEIRKAEARANEGKPVIDPRTLEEYKEGLKPSKLTGSLQRVDCLGSQARLHLVSGKRVTRILVVDPGQVEIRGGGERALPCGVQKPARPVAVHYTPRSDASKETAGEAVRIEFH
jgi:hypothetical protein